MLHVCSRLKIAMTIGDLVKFVHQSLTYHGKSYHAALVSTSPRLVNAVVLLLLTSEGELMDSEEVVCAEG
jgi:hypothetical protein